MTTDAGQFRATLCSRDPRGILVKRHATRGRAKCSLIHESGDPCPRKGPLWKHCNALNLPRVSPPPVRTLLYSIYMSPIPLDQPPLLQCTTGRRPPLVACLAVQIARECNPKRPPHGTGRRPRNHMRATGTGIPLASSPNASCSSLSSTCLGFTRSRSSFQISAFFRWAGL